MADLVKMEGLIEGCGCCSPCGHSKYPWGLTLDLNDEVVKALGISGAKVGDVLQITALAFVKSSNQRLEDDEGKEVDICHTLQVTAMSAEAPASAEEKAKRLFSSMQNDAEQT